MYKRIALASLVFAGLLLGLTTIAAQEEKVPLDKVPKAVLKAVKAKFPGAELKGAEREKEGDKVLYEINLVHKGSAIDVTLLANGKIIEIETTIPAKKLPKAVRQALNKKYPKSKITKAEVIVAGKTRAYEVLLTTAKNVRLEIKLDPKGKILSVEKDDEAN